MSGYEPGYEPQTIDLDRLSPAAREFLRAQGVPVPPVPSPTEQEGVEGDAKLPQNPEPTERES